MTDPWLDGHYGGCTPREDLAGLRAGEAAAFSGSREPAGYWGGSEPAGYWPSGGPAASWSGGSASNPYVIKAEPGPAVAPGRLAAWSGTALGWLPRVEALLPVAGGVYLAWKFTEVTVAAVARVMGVVYLNKLISYLASRWCPERLCSRFVPVGLGIGFYGGVLLLLLATVMFTVLVVVRQQQDGYWRLARWALLLLLLITAWSGGDMALSSLIPWL
jgi:hypothetical protein